MTDNRSDKVIIITAPSGAGKTSITHYLMEHIPQLAFSISAATRKARQNEVNGKDYYFISEDEFKDRIQNNEFAEWEMVYEGKYYGTLKSELERIWKEGRIPVLDVDVHGAIHVKTQYPDSSLTLFIDPPSVEELKKRLMGRGTETDETLQARVNKAGFEMSFKDQFDAVIVNDDLCRACEIAHKVVTDFIAKPFETQSAK